MVMQIVTISRPILPRNTEGSVEISATDLKRTTCDSKIWAVRAVAQTKALGRRSTYWIGNGARGRVFRLVTAWNISPNVEGVCVSGEDDQVAKDVAPGWVWPAFEQHFHGDR